MTRRIAALCSLGMILSGCLSPLPPSVGPSPSPVGPTPSASDRPGGDPSPSSTDAPSPPAGPSLDPAMVEGQLVQCGADSAAFPAELLLHPGAAETGQDAPAALLRGELGPPLDQGGLPPTGWIRVEIPPKTVLFIAPSPDGWAMVGVELGATGWSLDRYGSCALRPVLRAGVNHASWWIDPAGPRLGPNSTRVDALVLEEACASGKPPVGRVEGPVIDDRPDRVIVTFGVRAQPGGQECPSNPPLAVPFELPTSLAGRPLFDGGEFPPRDATVPAS